MTGTTSIEWTGGRLRYVDQTKLPDEVIFVETDDYRVVARSIKGLEIRGAPAIGVAAAFAVVLAASPAGAEQEHAKSVDEAITHLALTRPTAVNLFSSLKRMRACLSGPAGSGTLRDRLLIEAMAIRQEDIVACRRIADSGVTLIQPGSTLLTHCHTGALATGGGGTALFIITEAHQRGLVRRVYVGETRPLLQGSRLTAWELMQHGIEASLITDSTAGFLMKQGRVDAVLVGADRITANGDVANKIGTYSLAVLAAHHHIPFYVAAPVSTIDFDLRTGDQIPIEERDSREVTQVRGVRVAPEGVAVYAPAFDVTPNEFVTALVTNAGIIRPPFADALEKLNQSLGTAAIT